MYPRFAITLLLSFAAIGFGVAIPAVPVDQCGLNAEFRECGSACAPTCANARAMHPGPVCTLQCVTGCFCKEGFYKNHQGACVTLEECGPIHPQVNAAIAFPTCPDNEVFQACGSACAPNCANPHPSPVCTRNCVVGCFCKDGHLRNAQGVCVPANQCQVPETSMLFAFPPKHCGANEEFQSCGSACHPTCANPTPGPICTLQCVIGCFCKQGFLKNSEGLCVPANQCNAQVCGDNEEYRQCKGCDGTCDKPNPICPRICVPGCACKQGHLRTGVNGKCIPKEQCPATQDILSKIRGPSQVIPQCPQNEVFHSCGTACPATCANPHPSPVCTKNCVIGCFCQEGYLRNEKGVCVAATNCEAPKPIAAMMLPPNMCLSEHEVFVKECGNQVDCVNSCHVVTFLVHGVPRIPKKCMVRMCKPACVCKHPLVRNEQGDCVEKKECDQVPFTTTQLPLTTTY